MADKIANADRGRTEAFEKLSDEIQAVCDHLRAQSTELTRRTRELQKQLDRARQAMHDRVSD